MRDERKSRYKTDRYYAPNRTLDEARRRKNIGADLICAMSSDNEAFTVAKDLGADSALISVRRLVIFSA